MKENILLMVTICCVLALTASGQTKLPSGIKAEYDKFKDETEVVYRGFGHALWYRHAGATLTEDVEKFRITFFGARCEGYCFRSPTALIWMIDGERILGPVYERYLGDDVTMEIARDLVDRISKAKVVEYQIGEFERKLQERERRKFAELLAVATVKK